MTSASELLQRLRTLDIRLALDADRLAIDAPKGALTDDLRAELAQAKESLIEHLRAQAAAGAATAAALAAPEPVARSEHMPVSHTQQSLWFIRQLDPASYVYNLPAAMRLEGPLDVAALERALDELVQRHETLRTRFVTLDAAPRCVVEARVPVALERVDFSPMPAAEREAAMLAWVQDLSQRPFDLERAPLLHTGLVRMAPDEHVFVFVLDHIASDGLSLGIFIKDFEALYARHAMGTDAALPPLPIQYIDYAAWERGQLAQGLLEGHAAYWKQQLAGLPSLLQLPADAPRPRVQTTHGARVIADFPRELGERIKAFAREENATLFMVLLAAFQVLLHRHSGATDFAVGTAIANRNRPEVGRVIGFFANNLVIRGDLSGNPTGREVIARVRDTSLAAYAHQEMPFDMLVEMIGGRRELDHTPLFQVMFVLQRLSLDGLQLANLRCTMLENRITTARFDLAVDVFDLAHGMRVYFEYNTDLFEAATIERMMGHYRRLLEGFVAHPGTRIDELPMLSEAERSQHVVDWNRTDAEYPRDLTVHGLFEAQAQRAPEALAVVFESTTLTYRELDARANRMARHLRSLGVGRESLVGVWMERSEQMVVALLGILKAGGAYVPLDPAFPTDRIAYMIEDAGLAVVVTEERLAGTLPEGLEAVCVDRDAAALARWPDGELDPVSGPRDLAYLIYTSGSTGRPKGVELEHRSAVNFLSSMHREPGIAATDRFVSVTTLSFDIAGLEIHGPLTAGGTVVLAARATTLDGVRLAELLESSDATILQATPATWRLLLESGWRGRPGLKMLCGGEALPRDLAERLLALGGELWNLYGPTETTIWSTLARVTDAARAIPIGQAIANTQVYVLEPSGLTAPIGVAGELCIGGDGLARGYRNRPDLTAEKFVALDLPGVAAKRVYRTGDLARFLPDGQLEYVGRRDQQVKVRGFRIELGEIEVVLATHPGVRECVAHVREDLPGDQRLVGYVVPGAGVPFDADAARVTLRAKLPEYMVPGLIEVLDAMPLTPNGKIDRRRLPAPAMAARAHVAPRTPTEAAIAAIWRDVLGGPEVGVTENFFERGGHSLLATRVLSRLRASLGVELPLRAIFEASTVEGLARIVEGTRGAGRQEAPAHEEITI